MGEPERRSGIKRDAAGDRAMEPQALPLVAVHAASSQLLDLRLVEAPVNAMSPTRQHTTLHEIHDVLPGRAEYCCGRPGPNEFIHGKIVGRKHQKHNYVFARPSTLRERIE